MAKRRYINNLKIIFVFNFLFICLGLNSQELKKKPRLDFTVACGRDGFNNFSFKFDFSGSPFDPNNEFIVEMSDANGSFDNPVQVGSVKGKNFDYFNISGSFSVPKNTYGKKYKIRLKSTKPETMSPESDEFEAYYTTSKLLELNNYKPLFLCDGKATMRVNGVGDSFVFRWYRNDVVVAGENSSSLTVSQSGEYYAAVDYGSCGDIVKSNKVNVSAFNANDARIKGTDVVELCSSDVYQLGVTANDRSYKYKWYRNDKLITGLPDYTPIYTTPTSDQYGVYYVEIEVSEGCKVKSQKVTIKEVAGSGFTINAVGNLNKVLLPDETIVLSVSHNSKNPSYQWYKDGVPLPARNQPETNAVEPGVYYLEIKDNTTSCNSVKKSPEYKVVKPVKIVPNLMLLDYTECESESTKVVIESVQAEATDGELYELTTEQIQKLTVSWYKDDKVIPNVTGNEKAVPSYQDNGVYSVGMAISNLSGFSEKLNVFLIPKGLGVKQSSEFLCPGTEVLLTTNVVSGFNYTWLKGESIIEVADPSSISINATGTYTLKVGGVNGCSKIFDVEIKEFNGDVIKVSPSTTAVLGDNDSVVVTASGAKSYEWYNENGDLLSTSESVELNKIGVYKLVSKLDVCNVVKEIKVVEDDGSLIIPNVVSPFNADGVNDTWQIPNRYAFQKSITVIIYNSRGKEVLNTTDYQNDWPVDGNVKGGMIFYFKVIRDNTLVKAGTLSILK